LRARPPSSSPQSADHPDRAGPGGGIDLLSPVWNVFDLLPEGSDDWLPDNPYPGSTRGWRHPLRPELGAAGLGESVMDQQPTCTPTLPLAGG
jgi:hypothetical protein